MFELGQVSGGGGEVEEESFEKGFQDSCKEKEEEETKIVVKEECSVEPPAKRLKAEKQFSIDTFFKGVDRKPVQLPEKRKPGSPKKIVEDVKIDVSAYQTPAIQMPLQTKDEKLPLQNVQPLMPLLDVPPLSQPLCGPVLEQVVQVSPSKAHLGLNGRPLVQESETLTTSLSWHVAPKHGAW